jgi:hypothetical protein
MKLSLTSLPFLALMSTSVAFANPTPQGSNNLLQARDICGSGYPGYTRRIGSPCASSNGVHEFCSCDRTNIVSFRFGFTFSSPCRLAVSFESSQFSKNLFLLFSDDVVQREPVKLLMGPSGQLADFVQSKFRQNVPAANGSMARTARRVGSSAVPGMMGLGLCVFEEKKRERTRGREGN